MFCILVIHWPICITMGHQSDQSWLFVTEGSNPELSNILQLRGKNRTDILHWCYRDLVTNLKWWVPKNFRSRIFIDRFSIVKFKDYSKVKDLLKFDGFSGTFEMGSEEPLKPMLWRSLDSLYQYKMKLPMTTIHYKECILGGAMM